MRQKAKNNSSSIFSSYVFTSLVLCQCSCRCGRCLLTYYHLLPTSFFVYDLHKPRKLRLTSEGIDALTFESTRIPTRRIAVLRQICGDPAQHHRLHAQCRTTYTQTTASSNALISLCHPFMAVMVLKSDGVNTVDGCKLIYPYSIAHHLTKFCGSFIFNIACSTICVRVQRRGSQLYGCRQHSKLLIDMHIKLYYKH